MADPVRKYASDGDQKGIRSGQRSVDIGTGLPEPAAETIAALPSSYQAEGGELVLNVAGSETERFERAVRRKIAQ
jgi:hypothetical protein